MKTFLSRLAVVSSVLLFASVSQAANYSLQIQFGSWSFLGANGPKVEAGQPLHVSYVRDWKTFGLTEAPRTIEVQYRIGGGAVQSMFVKNQFADADGRIGFNTTIRIPVTAAGDLEVWFKFTQASGYVGWDSNGGANFRAKIIGTGSPVIRFMSSRVGLKAPELLGTLSAGAELRIEYEFNRLPHIGTAADPTHTFVTGTCNFFDSTGRLMEAKTTVMNANGISAPVTIPNGAVRVEIYFLAVRHGNTFWDSNGGQNYRFDIR